MIRYLLHHLYHFAVALAGLTLLLSITAMADLSPHLAELTLFLVLSVVVKRAGFHIAPKVTHSLVGVVDLTSLITFGAAGGGWVAGLSGALHIFSVWARHRATPPRTMVSLAAFSFGLKACMAYVAAQVYLALGGRFWLATIGVSDMLPIAVLCLLWFALDHVGWGLSEALEKGRAGLIAFFQTIIKASLLVELMPLPGGALLAYQFATLDRSVFLAVSVGVVVASIAVQRVADLAQAYIKRGVELQTLNDFAQELSRMRFDEPQILELVYHYASRVADTSNFAISLEDERTGEVELSVWFRDGARQPPHRYKRWGGLAGWTVQNRQPFLARDVHHEPLPVNDMLMTASGMRAALFAPLMTKDKVIGVVSVQSQQPHRFTVDQEGMFLALASQAAQEIVQARLYRAEQRRTRQLETIAAVSQRVAGIYDLDSLMEFTTAMIKVNFEYYHAEIFLLRDNRLVSRAGTVPRRAPASGLKVEQTSLISTVALSGEPLIVNDVSKEPRFLCDADAPLTASELVVPLKAEGKLLGVLEVQSEQVNAFTPSDVYVMQTLADQIAMALQEAELFASVQQEAYVSNALLQVADSMSNLSSVHEILAMLVRITPFLVGVRHCFVMLWDHQAQRLIGGESYGLCDECARELRELRLDPVLVFADGVLPSAPSPREAVLPGDFAERWQISQLLILPMLIRGTLLGAFCVDAQTALDARKVTLLSGMANQTAVAVEAVQLEMERDLRAQLHQELTIGRTIQSSLLPRDLPRIECFDLAAVWRPALQVAGDFFDFVPLLEDRWGIVVADVSDKGVPAAIYMTLSRTIIRAIALGRAARRTPHQVLERANEIIMADARTDMFVTAFYAVLDPVHSSVVCASAGHCPPLLFRAQDRSAEWVRGYGLPLGVKESIEIAEQEFTLQSGDVLVLYTDGVTEAMNGEYELFGAQRLRETVLGAHHLSAQEIMEQINAAVHDFVGGSEQVDDLTMVVVKCR